MTPRLRNLVGAVVFAAALSLAACGDDDSNSREAWQRYADSGSTTEIHGTAEYTSEAVDFSGPTKIRTLLDVTKGDTVWFGFGAGDAYPTGRKKQFDSACEPDFGNTIYEVGALPATIEGVVTLVPRHYEKPALCGQDHRFYGSYYIQDSSGSILVLRDSRVAQFDFGDRVRIEVRGLMKSFGTMKVTAFEEVTIERDGGAAPYKTIDQSFESYFGPSCSNLSDAPSIPEDLGDSFRVSGRVCQVPTTRNFGEFVIYPEGRSCSSSPNKQWVASLGVELEPRIVNLERGDSVTVTGPVTCGFGSYSMVVSSIAQFEKFRQDPAGD